MLKRFLWIIFCIAFFLLSFICFRRISVQSAGPTVHSVPSTENNVTFVLDAGHGGEDGGAVAPDGTPEKEINLNIEQTLAALFVLYGLPFVETRTEDTAIGDNTLATVGERKRSDILTRYQIVNETPGSILLSIHQNQFRLPQYSGTQVFYSSAFEEAKTLAQLIQSTVSATIQPNNTRQIKPSGSNIFLLYKAKRPSVLIECGFLSNPDELQILKTQQYDTELSYAILHSVLAYYNQIKGDTAV